MLTLFGWPLSGMRVVTASVLASTTSSVWRTSLVRYSRAPSGELVTPCGISTPFSTLVTRLVAGSIRCAPSPAALVWMMRTAVPGGMAALVGIDRPPRTQAARICHSGSLCDCQCLPPPWNASPPASRSSGCSSSRLVVGEPGTTSDDADLKFLRAASSLHEVAPSGSGSSCSRVPTLPSWQVTQRHQALALGQEQRLHLAGEGREVERGAADAPGRRLRTGGACAAANVGVPRARTAGTRIERINEDDSMAGPPCGSIRRV